MLTVVVLLPAAALLAPASAHRAGAALWLLALLPVAELARVRGPAGAAAGLFAGGVAIALSGYAAHAAVPLPPDVGGHGGAVAAYALASLWIGAAAARLRRERDTAAERPFTDGLTGLANRRYGEAFLDAQFAAARRGRLLAVVLFDVDRLEAFNARYGRARGDAALAAIGAVLRAHTRRMNVTARHGGQEFMSVLTDADLPGTLAFVERIRTALVDEPLPGGGLTVSAGVALYEPALLSPADLIERAQRALYQAKRAGRDCVRVAPVPPPAEAPAGEPLLQLVG